VNNTGKNETPSNKQTFTVNDKSRLDGQNYINNLNEIIAKNADAMDKLIITLSSGFLAISISFIDKIVPLGIAHLLSLLLMSWSCFVLSIIINVISFFVAHHECNRRKRLATEFYFEGIIHAGVELKRETVITQIINYFSAGFYLAGTVFITLFVSLNIYFSGGTSMADQKLTAQSQNASVEIKGANDPTRKRETPDEGRGRPTSAGTPSIPAHDTIADDKDFTRGRTSAIPPSPPIDQTIVKKTNVDKK
jgi:hypothetical protein